MKISLFNFCKKDLQKFVLLLRKSAMCYKHIDSWRILPAEEKFSSKLNPKEICDKDYRHAQRL